MSEDEGLGSGTGDGGEDGIAFFVGIDRAVGLEVVKDWGIGVNQGFCFETWLAGCVISI